MLDLLTHLAQDEDQLLNNIWIGLLGVEALMVLGVAVRGLVGAVSSSRSRRRRSSVGTVSGMSVMSVGVEDDEGLFVGCASPRA
jgi:hypothetical protein